MAANNSIVIVAATRTPMGNFNGVYKNVSTTQLGAAVLASCIAKAKLKPGDVQEVLMGCVLPAGLGQAPARQAAIGAGLPTSTPCTTINKVCGSGMKSVMIAHDEIMANTYHTILAGGMENMSRAPYLLQRARFGYRLGHGALLDHMMLDGLEDAYSRGEAMGLFAEKCVDRYKITRKKQDEFALESLKRAKEATKNGSFKEEIISITINNRNKQTVITEDEGPITAKAEKIPTLKPAFKEEGTITAANSSSISDGAAAVLLMAQSQAEEHKIKPLAKIIGHYSHAQKPEWFTTAPISAIQELLKKINWTVEDVDLFEINEAFAIVPIVVMRELNIAHDKLNIHGGACILGHPIGASGARILVTLIHALIQKKLKRGIAALCIGGGEATAIAIEVSYA